MNARRRKKDEFFNLFSHQLEKKDPLDYFVPGYTKEQCNYQEGEWPYECGTCAHIVCGQRDYNRGRCKCKIVQGHVNEHDVCDFWTTGKLPGKQLGSNQEDISI